MPYNRYTEKERRAKERFVGDMVYAITSQGGIAADAS